MGRAPCCDKANVKRGPWSPEEDATLKSYIEQHGTGGNWIALPQKIGLKRCGKSCRLRWLNYLRPNIKHGGFSEEEDNIICNLYINIGSRWSIIAAQLPGRTDNDIKNYWNTRLKKKLVGLKQRNKQIEALAFPNSLINNQEIIIKENESCFSVLYPPAAGLIMTSPYWQEVLPMNPNYYPQQLPSSSQFGADGSTTGQILSQGMENLQAELNELMYTNPQVELDGSESTLYGFDVMVNGSTGTSSASAESGTCWGEIDSSFVCSDQLMVSESCHETSTYNQGAGGMLQDSSSFAFEDYSNYFVQK